MQIAFSELTLLGSILNKLHFLARSQRGYKKVIRLASRSLRPPNCLLYPSASGCGSFPLLAAFASSQFGASCPSSINFRRTGWIDRQFAFTFLLQCYSDPHGSNIYSTLLLHHPITPPNRPTQIIFKSEKSIKKKRLKKRKENKYISMIEKLPLCVYVSF